jgi:MFS family permease
MSRRPLLLMSAAYFLILCAAFGTGGLWPVYVSRLGGGALAAGLFNAAGNIAQAAGQLLSGWLAGRLGRRREIYLAGCALFAVTWWLMGRATTWQELTLINFAGGFTFGVLGNMIFVLTGLLAGERERGQSFGLLSLTVSASLLAGGIVAGPIADRWGFPTLMTIDAVLCGVCVLPGLFFADPRERARGPSLNVTPAPPATGRPAGLGRSYYLLAGVTLLGALAGFGGNLGRSIAMGQLGFSATAISVTTAIGGAVGLPAPLLLGWLSDRLGRKGLLLLVLASGLLSLPALAFAGSAWSFWGASVLLSVLGSYQPLTLALVTDLLPAGRLSMGLSLLNGANSIGLFMSSLGIGLAMQDLGIRPAFLLTALAPLICIALVLAVPKPGARRESVQAAGADTRP